MFKFLENVFPNLRKSFLQNIFRLTLITQYLAGHGIHEHGVTVIELPKSRPVLPGDPLEQFDVKLAGVRLVHWFGNDVG